MRIVMMTNTYFPHVGGVARSVTGFSEGLRNSGHQVMVVAPEFPDMPEEEVNVVRIPAIQRFNGSDFSVRLPVPGFLDEPLEEFSPEIIHSHHPFLVGDTAVRVASDKGLPLVFTHHTLYEQYTHYVNEQSEALKLFVMDLSTGYANLCDRVVAPSQSIADLLVKRGVTTPITVVPTGIDLQRFKPSDRVSFRRAQGIPPEAFLVGHVGRLAQEKNLAFLTETVAAFLQKNPEAWFILVGQGPLEPELRGILSNRGVSERIRFLGVLGGDELAEAYGCMDVFAFTSHSETQGMVLAEAMACGVPVVGLDASGVREVIRDYENGRLLKRQDGEDFIAALEWVGSQDEEGGSRLREGALATARDFSQESSVKKIVGVYNQALEFRRRSWEVSEDDLWSQAIRRIQAEWGLLSNLAHAAGMAISGSDIPTLEADPTGTVHNS